MIIVCLSAHSVCKFIIFQLLTTENYRYRGLTSVYVYFSISIQDHIDHHQQSLSDASPYFMVSAYLNCVVYDTVFKVIIQ